MGKVELQSANGLSNNISLNKVSDNSPQKNKTISRQHINNALQDQNSGKHKSPKKQFFCHFTRLLSLPSDLTTLDSQQGKSLIQGILTNNESSSIVNQSSKKKGHDSRMKTVKFKAKMTEVYLVPSYKKYNKESYEDDDEGCCSSCSMI